MLESSKKSGKRKSKSEPTKILINEQVKAKRQSVMEKLELHYSLSRIKYLLREKIEIERLVTRPIPCAAYDLKNEIVDDFLCSNLKVQHKSIDSFSKKVNEFITDNPIAKDDTVESYIIKHAHYMPIEFQYLMRQEGKIDISNCSIENIEDAIIGVLRVDQMIDELLSQECLAQKIDGRTLVLEKGQYSPQISWESGPKEFVSLFSSLVKMKWITMLDTKLDSQARQYSYHFLIKSKGVEVDPRYLSKIVSKTQKDLIDIPDEKQKKRDRRDYPFCPSEIPARD
jgi:hypothetical protein